MIYTPVYYFICMCAPLRGLNELVIEPHREKTGLLPMRKNKGAKLISAFVFATRIVRSLSYLNTKFQASYHLLWLYSPVCVGPGQKPKLLVFSRTGSIMKEATHD